MPSNIDVYREYYYLLNLKFEKKWEMESKLKNITEGFFFLKMGKYALTLSFEL